MGHRATTSRCLCPASRVLGPLVPPAATSVSARTALFASMTCPSHLYCCMAGASSHWLAWSTWSQLGLSPRCPTAAWRRVLRKLSVRVRLLQLHWPLGRLIAFVE